MIHEPHFVLPSTTRHAAWALIVFGAGAAATGLAIDPQRTWPYLLLNAFYVLAAALGGMVFIALQYLSGASWCAALRRIPEAMMAALPASAVLMLSLFFGRAWLYPWSSGAHAAEHASAGRAVYLGAPFFFGRMALFLAAWMVFAHLIRKSSLRQDEDRAAIHHRRLVRYSAAFIVVFAISFSLASFDWLMSRIPGWTSTIFAFYTFAGLLVQGIAAITLITVLLEERGYLTRAVTDDRLHDLGKLLFAFSTFWAYMWFSQYLLIWYGNIPEEVTYYVRRTGEHWIALFILNIGVNWAIPFLVLMPRSAKRNRAVLKWIAALILAGRWLDLYLTVMPEAVAAPGVRVVDVLIAAGYAGVFVLMASRALASAPLVPVNDPSFTERLAHHQRGI